MKVQATHYICIKDKDAKDVFIMRKGDERAVSKKELELLDKEAQGKFTTIKEGTNEKDTTK
jgi:hypothetical protein